MVIEYYKRGIKIKFPQENASGGGKKEEVEGFSLKTQKALSWAYMQGPWRSMITLTYHNKYPKNPKESKYQLHKLCKELRKRGIKYLWVLEFQNRGFPHYHFWLDREFNDCPLSEDKDPENSWRWFVEKWLKVSGQYYDKKARDFHTHQKMYTKWNVIAGENYAVKYAEKSIQKGLPKNIKSYGKWWGCSRGSVKIDDRKEYIDDDPSLRKDIIQFRRQVQRLVDHWKKKKKRKFRASNKGIQLTLRESRYYAVMRLEKYYISDNDIIDIDSFDLYKGSKNNGKKEPSSWETI